MADMNRESHFGTIEPYGIAIRQAKASGDTTRMRQVAEDARKWLSDNPGHAKQGEVHAALRELNEAMGGS